MFLSLTTLETQRAGNHGGSVKATTTWLVLQLLDVVLRFREHFRRL